jgi:hypothetical protein
LLFSGAAGCVVPSLPQVQELLKVKVSQQFTFFCAAGCVVPSLSQAQVEVLKAVSQQFAFLVLQVSGSIIIPSTELLKVKYPNSLFSGAVGLLFIIFPSTGRTV